jgi:hypothetical protein
MATRETFDLESLTWGELGMVELASGLSSTRLLNVASYRQALVTMVLASRNGEDVPSWHELMSRKVLGGSSSPSPTPPDSPSETSSD